MLLVFTFILIGIVGNYIQNNGYLYSSFYSSLTRSSTSWLSVYTSKYPIAQAQLSFGILMMFSGLFYVAIYIYAVISIAWRSYHAMNTFHVFLRELPYWNPCPPILFAFLSIKVSFLIMTIIDIHIVLVLNTNERMNVEVTYYVKISRLWRKSFSDGAVCIELCSSQERRRIYR